MIMAFLPRETSGCAPVRRIYDRRRDAEHRVGDDRFLVLAAFGLPGRERQAVALAELAGERHVEIGDLAAQAAVERVCTPGLVVATADLLRRNAGPSDDEIREALSGNLCRCTGYAKIFDAVRLTAGQA